MLECYKNSIKKTYISQLSNTFCGQSQAFTLMCTEILPVFKYSGIVLNCIHYTHIYCLEENIPLMSLKV